MEAGETPQQAVPRELYEELGIRLTGIRELGAIDHTWFWNGGEMRERAWVFLASSSDDARLSRGETPDLIEANGQRFKTLWRPLQGDDASLAPLCPSALAALLNMPGCGAIT
jgi:8-oxo-dGTP pyrophosphatase MutT (NUDIX family)